jgi:membrane-associated phospholipid phosphatase
MPRSPCTAPTLRLLGAAALCAGAAALVAALGADAALLRAVNDGAAARLPAWLPSALTVLGHGLVAVMLVAPFLGRAPWIPAGALLAALPGAVFSRAGKLLAARPRPAALLDPAQLHVQGSVLAGHNSFPSGHSITIFLVVAVVALGLSRGAQQAAGVAQPAAAPRAALAALFALGALVAASRLMVGAHWPSDALGGAALGLLAGVLGGRAALRWPWWRRPGAALALALGVLGCAAALPWVDTGYPLAQPVQWVAAALGGACALRRLAQLARGARA